MSKPEVISKEELAKIKKKEANKKYQEKIKAKLKAVEENNKMEEEHEEEIEEEPKKMTQEEFDEIVNNMVEARIRERMSNEQSNKTEEPNFFFATMKNAVMSSAAQVVNMLAMSAFLGGITLIQKRVAKPSQPSISSNNSTPHTQTQNASNNCNENYIPHMNPYVIQQGTLF
jgi:DNA-directed RNA polymerase beta' subunit